MRIKVISFVRQKAPVSSAQWPAAVYTSHEAHESSQPKEKWRYMKRPNIAEPLHLLRFSSQVHNRVFALTCRKGRRRKNQHTPLPRKRLEIIQPFLRKPLLAIRRSHDRQRKNSQRSVKGKLTTKLLTNSWELFS